MASVKTAKVTPNSTSGKAVCLDIDEILTKWAEGKLGSEVDKIDVSGVHLHQTCVTYQSSGNWFGTTVVHEEVFDNDGRSQASWQYVEQVKFPSTSTWTITKGYRSKLLPKAKLVVEFPMAEEGKAPLSAAFESPLPELGDRKVTIDSNWEVNAVVCVKPFSTTRAYAEVRTCVLKAATFSTEVEISGVLKFTGKNQKSSHQKEMSVNIADALESHPNFTIIEGDESDDAYKMSRRASFRVEGVCSGEVGLSAHAKTSELQSLV